MSAALAIAQSPRQARRRPCRRLPDSVTFTYDPNGNVISEVTDAEVMTYAWNADDRLVGIARDEEPVAAYAYDAGGRRVAATTDAGTTNYLWDEQNLLAELDETLATLAQYTDFPGVWGGLSSVRAGGASAFFAPDLSSNIRLLLNAAGGMQQASLYSAFGVPLAGATASPFGFGGGLGYFDDGLDRLYVRARHYPPGLGAWMSRDPLGGFLGGYGYVGNSPVGWVDPSGWQRIEDTLRSAGAQRHPGAPGLLAAAPRQMVVTAGDRPAAAPSSTTDPTEMGRNFWTSVESTMLARPSYQASTATRDLRRGLDGAREAGSAATKAASTAAAKGEEFRHAAASRRAYQGWVTRRAGIASPKLAEATRRLGVAVQEATVAAKKHSAACQAARTAQERSAAALSALESLSHKIQSTFKGLGRAARSLDDLLKLVEEFSSLLNKFGLGLAAWDLVKAILSTRKCLRKQGGCKPRVCYAPTAAAVVEVVAALAAFNIALTVPSIIFGLIASWGSSLYTWWNRDCFA